MKKRIALLLLSALLMLALTSCFSSPKPQNTTRPSTTPPTTTPPTTTPPVTTPPVTTPSATTPPVTPDPPAPTACELLSSLAGKSYARVELTVITRTGFAELSAVYTLTQNTVSYSVEQLLPIPTDGSLPSGYKTTLSGSARVENGTLVELDGSSVTLPTYDELTSGFHFEESNLENVVSQNGLLTADVCSPSAFYGRTVDLTDLKISVEYSETALLKMVLSYRSASADVTTTYAFGS